MGNLPQSSLWFLAAGLFALAALIGVVSQRSLGGISFMYLGLGASMAALGFDARKRERGTRD